MPPAQLLRLLTTALAHHQAGRLDQADQLYRQVWAAEPRNFDAVHLSGTVAYQKANYKEAVDLLTRAHRLNPRSASCETRLGLSHFALGQTTEATTRLRSASRVDPKLIDAWLGLGLVLRSTGKPDEAIACYERVVQLDPKTADAHNQIGAITAQTQGFNVALPHFRKAVALDPRLATAWCNLGLALVAANQFEEALASFDRALALDLKLVPARVGRALAFQQSYQLDEAIAGYGEALALQPENHEARSGRLLALNYRDDWDRDTLFREHLEFGRIAETKNPTTTFRNAIDPERKLRVAFLSPDLRTHSVAYFLEPILRHLDRSQFEIVLYHDHFQSDAWSERLRQHAVLWRNFAGRPHDVVEATIRSDQPDVLIDLAGHTGINRLPLFARRLARVQISYLGYPNTTGLRAMDFRFVDATTDPGADDDAWHTEKLIRFSPCAWAYEPPSHAPEPTRTGHERFTFGSFNNLAKLSPFTLKLWSKVLQATPESRLLLKGHGLENPLVRDVMTRRIRDAGIDLTRVQLLGRTPDVGAHLEVYRQVDVALDAFPYHGTTTTCEALWMGVPVVVLAGDRHASRVGASLLQAVKHPGWIAGNADQYVAIATQLARNAEKLSRYRSELRGQMQRSVLLDHAAQAERFGASVRHCWRQHRDQSEA